MYYSYRETRELQVLLSLKVVGVVLKKNLLRIARDRLSSVSGCLIKGPVSNPVSFRTFSILKLCCLRLLCASVGLLIPCASAEEPGSAKGALEPSRRAWELVQQLGSDKFAARVQARNGLMELGRPAIEPLEYAAQSDDPEIRMRAGEILIALRGRGFLGVGLQEEEELNENLEDAPDSPPFVVAPSRVVATQVVNFQAYSMYGVNKPFPAEGAGIQPGDKILAVNGKPLNGVKDLMREVIIIGPARTAVLTIDRGGSRMKVPVTLTRNPVFQRTGPFGSEAIPDPPPPVDLEKEAETANNKQASGTAAPARYLSLASAGELDQTRPAGSSR